MIETVIKSTETIEKNNFERIGNGLEFKLPKDSRSKEVSDAALDAKIEAAAHSAGVFFNLPEATIEKGNTIGVRTKDGATFKDDVFVYNLEQFKKMECTSFEDITKVWSHECGHRLLQNVFPSCWADELGADFFTGVRSEMLGLPKGNFEKMLGSTKASESHPNGALRIQAMDYGRYVAAQMKRSGIQPTWENCLEAYTKSPFATMTYENAKKGGLLSNTDNKLLDKIVSKIEDEKISAFIDDREWHLREAQHAKEKENYYLRESQKATDRKDYGKAADYARSAEAQRRRAEDEIAAAKRCTK